MIKSEQKYSKLRGKIREVYKTQENFAVAINMNLTTLSSKLTGKTDWTRGEIERCVNTLNIPIEEAHTYFFAL